MNNEIDRIRHEVLAIVGSDCDKIEGVRAALSTICQESGSGFFLFCSQPSAAVLDRLSWESCIFMPLTEEDCKSIERTAQRLMLHASGEKPLPPPDTSEKQGNLITPSN